MAPEVERAAVADRNPRVELAVPTGATALRFTYSALLLLVALTGTFALGAWSGISTSDVLKTLGSTPISLVGTFVALTIAQVALSAWKWQLVLRKLRPDRDDMPFGFLFDCTALSVFLSQFLTVYLSSIVVRGWVLKRNYGLTPRFSSATSLFEQIFDVVTLLIMALPALIVWSFGGTFDQWMLVTAAVVAAGAFSVRLVPLALRTATRVHAVAPRLRSLSEIFNTTEASGLTAAPFLLNLYALSVARYLVMLARIPALAVVFGFPLAMKDVIPGFTVVQATQLAAITPGQLGIREWTWSGVLAARGYDLHLAARFAIDLRIIGTVAMCLGTITCIRIFRARQAP